MSANILVFDSGVGGLSILAEVRKQLPQANYCYLFDNARLPYGELDEQELIQGCVELIARAVTLSEADIVIVACNSASTLILPALRETLTIPVVGVVPAIKPAARLSKNKHLGLLATPGTVNRRYTQELIDKFARDCRVDRFGSSELVYIAEAKMAQQPLDLQTLHEVLKPIKESGLDTLVLGCTHFPILASELQDYLGEGVILLDSSRAIAARVMTLIQMEGKQGLRGQSQAFYTTTTIAEGLKTTLAAWGFSSVVSFAECAIETGS
ncbi:glutamate racemase [Shewanella marisflavi]|uniref:glutamate racemase n=1 Tax=Shewanella marisflavi TaxID=260364 RepID=UPI003AAC186F